jgi:hypothetical protein
MPNTLVFAGIDYILPKCKRLQSDYAYVHIWSAHKHYMTQYMLIVMLQCELQPLSVDTLL